MLTLGFFFLLRPSKYAYMTNPKAAPFLLGLRSSKDDNLVDVLSYPHYTQYPLYRLDDIRFTYSLSYIV
jgi:hypothetical protein